MNPRARLDAEHERIERIITVAQAGGCSDEGVEAAIEAIRTGAHADAILGTMVVHAAQPALLGLTAERLGMRIPVDAVADRTIATARAFAEGRLPARMRTPAGADIGDQVADTLFARGWAGAAAPASAVQTSTSHTPSSEPGPARAERGDLGDQVADIIEGRRGRGPLAGADPDALNAEPEAPPSLASHGGRDLGDEVADLIDARRGAGRGSTAEVTTPRVA